MPQTEEQRQNAIKAAGVPTADISSFTDEQKRLFQQAASLGSGVNVIDSTALQSSQDQLNLPPASTPKDFQPLAQSSLETLLANFSATTPQETQIGDTQSQLLKTLERLGTQTQRKQELETQTGLPQQRKELQSIIGQLQGLQKEALAIPLQIQQESLGRGVTAAGVAPIETGRLRENAIKSLGLAAIGQTLQGNISLAQSNIQSALDAEFEPERQKLDMLKTIYQFNRDTLERVDKKRADVLNIILSERDRLLRNEEANKEEIYKIGQTAAKYGADTSTVQKIFAAKTREEALANAGAFLQDPRAKIELENARLDTLIKSQQLRKVQLENAFIGKPSGKELKVAQEKMLNAKTSAAQAQDQIGEINKLFTHGGLDSRVGTGMFNRASQGFWDSLSRIGASTATGAAAGAAVGAFTGPGALITSGIGALGGLAIGLGSSLQGLPDAMSGAGQEFAGSVHMITSQLTLDKLIQAKAAGATFGALSDGERIELSNAASKIKDWEIKDDKGNGTGFWNINEGSFKKELERIRALTQRALERSGQSMLSSDVEDILEGLESIQEDVLTPGINYY